MKYFLYTFFIFSLFTIAHAGGPTSFVPSLLPLKDNAYSLGTTSEAWADIVASFNDSGATRCVNITSSGVFGIASADCGTGGSDPNVILKLQGGTTYLSASTTANSWYFDQGFVSSASSTVVGQFTVSGNVGIGTASPLRPLDVNGAINATTGTGANGYYIGDVASLQKSSNNLIYGFSSSVTGHVFYADTVPRFRIVSGGNVGVATATPSSLFSVQGNALISGTTTLKAVDATSTLRVRTLASCDTVDTDAEGHFKCGSDASGANFGQAWEITSAGYLAPTTTITTLLNNGFVSQASSTVNGDFIVVPSNYSRFHGSAFDSLNISFTGVLIHSGDLTEGAGNFGTPIEFSKLGSSPTKKAAIVPVQRSSDNDTLGLSFWVSQGSTSADPVIEVLRLEDGGNIGIGDTNPSAKLQVAGDVSAQYFTATSSSATSTLAGGLAVNTSGLVYDFSSGNVGIGTAAPISLLQLNQTPGNLSDTPTLAFGDGDTGFYESADDQISISLSTVNRYLITASVLRSLDSGGFYLNRVAGTETTPTYTFVGDTNTGLFSDTADTLQFSVGGSERVRINSSGNVGIGTTTPAGKLQVSGDVSALPTTNVYQQFEVTGGSTLPTARLSLGTLTSGVGSAGVGTGIIQALQNASAFKNLALNPSGGNVGIGTTSPSQLLSVQGNALISGTSTVKSLDATSTLRVRTLASCDTVDTDAEGHFKCGSDATGGGGASFGQAWEINASGNLAPTTTPLTVEVTYLGVATSSLTTEFAVQGNAFISGTTTVGNLTATGTTFLATDGSKVGIGTKSPINTLDVNGGIDVAAGTGNNGVTIDGVAGLQRSSGNLIYGFSGSVTGQDLYTDGISRFKIISGGNVGISTATPSELLSVQGNALISGTTTTGNLTATGTISGSFKDNTQTANRIAIFDTNNNIASQSSFVVGGDNLELTGTLTVSGSQLQNDGTLIQGGQAQLNVASAGTPAITMTQDDLDTGFYSDLDDADQIQISTGGVFHSIFNLTGLGIASSSPNSALSINGDIVSDGNLNIGDIAATGTLRAQTPGLEYPNLFVTSTTTGTGWQSRVAIGTSTLPAGLLYPLYVDGAINSSWHHFHEDFLGEWNLNVSTADTQGIVQGIRFDEDVACTFSKQNNGIGGIVLLVTGGTNGDACHLDFNDINELDYTVNPIFEATVRQNTTQSHEFVVGFTDIPGNAVNNAYASGIVFSQTDSGNWQAITTTGTATTTTDTGFPANNISLVKLTIFVDDDQTARFYIDNKHVATHTTNVPTGNFEWTMRSEATAGGAPSLSRIDWLDIWWDDPEILTPEAEEKELLRQLKEVNQISARGAIGTRFTSNQNIKTNATGTLISYDFANYVQGEELKIKTTNTQQDDALLGVYIEDTDAQIILGGGDILVATFGRARVKVTGLVPVGWYVTSSSITGVAEIAKQDGIVLGRALESYNGKGIGEILVEVNIGYQKLSPFQLAGASSREFSLLGNIKKFLGYE